jgi:hypothetical protein
MLSTADEYDGLAGLVLPAIAGTVKARLLVHVLEALSEGAQLFIFKQNLLPVYLSLS